MGSEMCIRDRINEWHEGPGTRTYDSSQHLSMFRSLDRCMNAYRLWFDRARLQAARSSMVPFALPQAKAASDVMLDACTRGKAPSLTEVQAKRLFSIYGIVTTDDCICQTQAEAIAHADTIGYPVVAKIVSAAVQHKSDMGGVKINLSNATALSQAWQDITDSARVFGLPESEWKISVQPMIKPGVEMLVGARIDPQFGPLVVFGFGGTLVEVLRDVAVRLAPVDAQAVRSALDRLRLRPLLDGVRGAQPADIEFFVDQVVRLSHLISDQADRITEIDINPIVLHNHGGVAVDGVVVLRDASN